MYTVAEAAQAAGTSKSTILRAIKKQSGKRLSATKGDDGQWQIDPAELHRVYPLAENDGNGGASDDARHDAVRDAPRTTHDAHYDAAEIKVLQVKLDAVQQVADDRAETITDLRDRLDRTEQQRDEATTKLTALLTDQRESKPEPLPTTTPAPATQTNYPLWGLVVAAFGFLIWLMLAG